MILEILLLQNHKDSGVFKSPLWKCKYLNGGKIYTNIQLLLPQWGFKYKGTMSTGDEAEALVM